MAQGVWDGVRGELGPARAGTAPPAPPQLGDAGSEILVIQELEDPGEQALVSGAASPFAADDAPWRQELRRQREASGVAVPAPAIVTVPVPPRASGGLVGNVVQSFVVGGEIMGALVTGPVLAFARSTVQAFDRVVRGVPSALGSGIRFVLFLLLMGLLGAVSAGVLLAALALNP